MSLKEIDGNLIEMFEEGKFDVIIHQCNCFNNMGAGIAAVIAGKYPEADKADKATKLGDINKLGAYQSVPTKHGVIINLYGQYSVGMNYGTPTSYLALQTALRNIAKEYKGQRIGTYQLGCNRGGADWSKVKHIVSSTIAHQNEVTIVNYKESNVN